LHLEKGKALFQSILAIKTGLENPGEIIFTTVIVKVKENLFPEKRFATS
jgi:hypothetical protein